METTTGTPVQGARWMATVQAGFVDMAERLGGIEEVLVDVGARVGQLEETEKSVSAQSAQQWAAQAA